MQNYTPAIDALRDQFAPGTATIPLATLEQATQLVISRSADLAGNNQLYCPRMSGSQHHPNPAINLNSSLAAIVNSPVVIDIFGTLSPETLHLITNTVNDVIAYLFPGGNSSTIGLIQDGLDYFIQNFSVDDLVAYLPEVLAFFGSGLPPAPIVITPAPITPTPVLSEAEELAQLLNELQMLVDNNPTLGVAPNPTPPPIVSPIATPPNPVIAPIAPPPIVTTPPNPTTTTTTTTTTTATDAAELEALLAELEQLVNANGGL